MKNFQGKEDQDGGRRSVLYVFHLKTAMESRGAVQRGNGSQGVSGVARKGGNVDGTAKEPVNRCKATLRVSGASEESKKRKNRRRTLKQMRFG